MQSEEGVAAAKAKLYDISLPLFDSEDARAALRNAAEAINAGKPFPAAIFSASEPGHRYSTHLRSEV